MEEREYGIIHCGSWDRATLHSVQRRRFHFHIWHFRISLDEHYLNKDLFSYDSYLLNNVGDCKTPEVFKTSWMKIWLCYKTLKPNSQYKVRCCLLSIVEKNPAI